MKSKYTECRVALLFGDAPRRVRARLNLSETKLRKLRREFRYAESDEQRSRIRGRMAAVRAAFAAFYARSVV